MVRRVVGILAVSLAIGLTAAALRAQAQAPSTIDDLVARNLQAKGGAERLKSVQSVKLTGQVLMQGMMATVTTYGKRPNLMRQEIDFGGQRVVSAFDGTTAWGIRPGASGPSVIEGVEGELITEQAYFDGPLIDYKARGYTAELMAPETVAGRPVHRIKLTKSGLVTELVLDAETGLESRAVIQLGGATMTQEFADYRDVQGLKVPHSIRTFVNGSPAAEIKVSAIELNPAIDDAIFRMK